MRFFATGSMRPIKRTRKTFSHGIIFPCLKSAGTPLCVPSPAGTAICSKVRKRHFSQPLPLRKSRSGSFPPISLRRKISRKRSGWLPRLGKKARERRHRNRRVQPERQHRRDISAARQETHDPRPLDKNRHRTIRNPQRDARRAFRGCLPSVMT